MQVFYPYPYPYGAIAPRLARAPGQTPQDARHHVQYGAQYGPLHGVQSDVQYGAQYRPLHGVQSDVQYGAQYGSQHGVQFGVQHSVPYGSQIDAQYSSQHGSSLASYGAPYGVAPVEAQQAGWHPDASGFPSWPSSMNAGPSLPQVDDGTQPGLTDPADEAEVADAAEEVTDSATWRAENGNNDEAETDNRQPLQDYGPDPFVIDIEDATKRNQTFRTALWTGNHLQLTLMSIPVGGEIGLERHNNVDQFIRIEEGDGLVQMGPTRETLTFRRSVEDDDVILIPAGTWHNLTNTGRRPIKLYSIYAPPNHPRGTVHRTKQEADAAEHGTRTTAYESAD